MARKKQEPEKKKIEGLAEIGIEDFAKVELRVAKILSCEPVKKSKKLLKLIFLSPLNDYYLRSRRNN